MRRIVVIAALLAACGKAHGPAAEAEEPIPAPPADAIVKESPQGAATITVRVWPAKPTLGDSIWLQLEAKGTDGVTFDMPFDQTALGRFQVLRYAPEGTKQTYELAAPMSGKHRIPPMRVIVHDRRAGAGTGTGTGTGTGGSDTEVLTDEIPLDVGAVLAAKTDQPLSAARGAIDTEPGGHTPWLPIALGGGGVVVVGLGVLLFFVLRARAIRVGRVTAWELAMRRLAELEARGAPAADDADGWFVALSGIVRTYVEGRFRLRAPELTTEEFLLEARRIPDLDQAHRDLLGSFLERCDRVKFAGWRPEAAESLEVLGAARSFVADSRPVEDADGRRRVRAPIAEVVS